MENNQELLQDIKEYINKVNNSIENVIEDIRENNNLNDLVDLLEGLTYCFKGLSLQKDIHNIDIDEDNLQIKIEEILDGVENGDFSLVADILEYELMEVIYDLNKDLEQL